MSLRLATISVIRNEADIVETFVRHHCGLGATMHFVLHRCIDNTEEILAKLRAEGLPVTVQTSDDAAYLQGERITEIAQRIAREKSADWILPLDADEFLLSADGRDIGMCLKNFMQDRIILMPWRTYVPTPDDDIAESCPVKRIVYRQTTETPVIRKVLIPAGALKGVAWKIPTGSHVVLDTQSQSAYPTIVSAELALAHFPVRSSEQLRAKILAGWIAVAATPVREPERCYHWKALLNRCMESQPLGPGELRNIALRYAAQQSSPLPTLTRDPIATSAQRPLYAIHTISAVAATFDAGLACAEIAEKQRDDVTGGTIEKIAERLQGTMKRLAHALAEHQNLPVLQGLVQEDRETHALTCAIAMLAGTLQMEDLLVGTSLSRRQQLARYITPLFTQQQWIPALLSQDKLPHTLERALQEVLSIVSTVDRSTLRQLCRTHMASDDATLAISQRLTDEKRSAIPLPLALNIAQSLQYLLVHEAATEHGLGNGHVRMIDPACARGEIGCELLRRCAHAHMECGAHPDTLRKNLLGQISLRESAPELLAITSVRMGITFANLHMPLTPNDELPVLRNGSPELLTAGMQGSIPVVATALVSNSNAFHSSEEALSLLHNYLRKVRTAGTDLDTAHSPLLQSIAHIHAVLRSAETSVGGVVIPRSILHEGKYTVLREMLIEDFEQLWILDLGGAYPSSSDDEPMEGSHESGMAILFLVRHPGSSQGTHYVSWNGLRIQKYHTLLSRGFADLPWKRIAPQKPGYVFLP